MYVHVHVHVNICMYACDYFNDVCKHYVYMQSSCSCQNKVNIQYSNYSVVQQYFEQ